MYGIYRTIKAQPIIFENELWVHRNESGVFAGTSHFFVDRILDYYPKILHRKMRTNPKGNHTFLNQLAPSYFLLFNNPFIESLMNSISVGQCSRDSKFLV